MALINEEKFRAAIARGMSAHTALEYLAKERNNLAVVTLETVGAASVALNNAEADARQQLNKLEADAAINVPLIERLMTEQGWATETPVCPECGKYRARLSGRVCSICDEPEEY